MVPSDDDDNEVELNFDSGLTENVHGVKNVHEGHSSGETQRQDEESLSWDLDMSSHDTIFDK